MEKDDFLKVCMSDPALVSGPMPIDLFNKSYCIVCSQLACARSRANTMAFSDRAQNWKKNLFDNPPRADDNDPRYANIRAKKFLDLHKEASEAGPGAARYEVQVPTDISTESQLPQTPVYSQTPVTPPVSPPEAPELEPPGPIIPPPNPNPPAKPVFDLNNTPFQQGTIISSKPEKEIIIEPGASFTFGSDDQQADKK